MWQEKWESIREGILFLAQGLAGKVSANQQVMGMGSNPSGMGVQTIPGWGNNQSFMVTQSTLGQQHGMLALSRG